MKLLHEELTYKIRQCIFEVRNELGAGFDEETYHQGLLLSLLKLWKKDLGLIVNFGLPDIAIERYALLKKNQFSLKILNTSKMTLMEKNGRFLQN